MRIPKQFDLAGKTIKIVYNNKLGHENEWQGAAVYREQKIEIQPSTKERPIMKANMEQTFCHEMVHWILYSMGEHELNHNEKFVDLFGCFLHQAMITMKYEAR